jgi:cytochrome c oxidase cbb3-type subunit 4
MDVNALRSWVTVVSLLLFIALVAWTWNRSRRDAFDEAARLPFADDAPTGEKQ